jgi:hypothetical protein
LAPELVLYREVEARPNQRDWIVEHDDYFHIRVPEGKTLSNEVFGKPCLIEMGDSSRFSGCVIQGFANVYGEREYTFEKVFLDGTRMGTETERSVLNVFRSERPLFIDIDIVGHDRWPGAISFEGVTGVTVL